MRKIFFFDIDGTILDTARGERSLPQPLFDNIKALRNSGNITVVCTARPKRFVDLLLPNLFNSCILLNGSYVEVEGHVLVDIPFSLEQIDSLNLYLNSIGASYIYIGNSYCWANNISYKYKNILDNIYMVGNGYTKFTPIGENKVYTIDLFFETDNDYEQISSYINSNSKITLNYRKGNFTADLSFNNKNKSYSIEPVLKYYGVDINNSYAFGDSLNDLDVFKLIPNTCAVDNASEQLKRMASFISNKRAGIGVLEGLNYWGYTL